MRRLVSIVVVLGVTLSGAAAENREITLFDGASLAGWHVSTAPSHSAPSGHRAGGEWRVVEGAIVGRQGPAGNGGLLTSDRQFGDIEISLETSDEWDSDSGLFLRTTPEGAAYQVMIDLYPGGTVGGLWGEALPETLDIRRFVFAESPAGTPGAPAGTRSALASPAIPRTSRRGSMGRWSSTSRIPSAGFPTAVPWRSRCMAAIGTTPGSSASVTSACSRSTDAALSVSGWVRLNQKFTLLAVSVGYGDV
jgi:hypothetical protein